MAGHQHARARHGCQKRCEWGACISKYAVQQLRRHHISWEVRVSVRSAYSTLWIAAWNACQKPWQRPPWRPRERLCLLSAGSRSHASVRTLPRMTSHAEASQQVLRTFSPYTLDRTVMLRGTDPDSSELAIPCLAKAAVRKRRASSGVAKPDRPAGCVYLSAANQRY